MEPMGTCIPNPRLAEGEKELRRAHPRSAGCSKTVFFFFFLGGGGVSEKTDTLFRDLNEVVIVFP